MTATFWFLVIGLILAGVVAALLVAQNIVLREQAAHNAEASARNYGLYREEHERRLAAEELEFQAQMSLRDARRYGDTILSFNRGLIEAIKNESNAKPEEKKAPPAKRKGR